MAPPTAFAPERLTIAKAEVSAGTLLSLALVGLVATAIIGAFFSIGFLLLSGPETHTTSVSAPNSAHSTAPIAPETGKLPLAAAAAIPGPAVTQHPAPIAPETGKLPLAAAAAIPGPAVTHPPAATEAAAPPPQTKVVQAAPPPAPSSGPSPQTAPPPTSETPVSTVSVVAVTDSSTGGPSSSDAASPRQDLRRPPARHPEPNHAKAASRHSHLRSARHSAPAAPRSSQLAQSLSPPPDQTRSFDQLVTQLTGETQPGSGHTQPDGRGQALTPPPADTPDPFAGR